MVGHNPPVLSSYRRSKRSSEYRSRSHYRLAIKDADTVAHEVKPQTRSLQWQYIILKRDGTIQQIHLVKSMIWTSKPWLCDVCPTLSCPVRAKVRFSGLAWTTNRLSLVKAANSDWLFEKVFGDSDFVAAGQLLIPPECRKPTKATKDNTYVKSSTSILGTFLLIVEQDFLRNRGSR